LWAVNTLLSNLPGHVKVPFEAWDIPFEKDARIRSKRTAELLCGTEPMKRYIDLKINEAVTTTDVRDWEYVRNLSTSVPFDLSFETSLMLRRLVEFKPQLEALRVKWHNDADFRGLDLDEFY
jgi:hypothetical protein